MDPAPRPSIRALLVTQFFGALNDNAWKMLVPLLLTAAAAQGLDDAATEVVRQEQTSRAFLYLLVPMLLVSLPAGALADRISKRTVIVGLKGLELALMTVGAISLFLAPDDPGVPLVVLALMGLQSGLFGPAKYGILPEILPHEDLSDGNGALEMWTFLAIIAGTALGPYLLGAGSFAPWMGAALLAVFAVIGFASSFGIPRVPPARGRGGDGSDEGLRAAFRAAREDRPLWLAIVGAAAFWAVATVFGQVIPVYTAGLDGVSELQSGIPLATFGIGVGVGSIAAGRLSGDKVEAGLIPLGAGGLGLFGLLLALVAPGFVGLLVIMALLGVSSGFLLVPLNALLQWRAPASCRGGVIACANVVAFAGMIAASFAVRALAESGADTGDLLLGAAVATLLGTAWAIWLLPSALIRLCLVLLTHTIYRLRVVGRTHVPEEGGVLLTPNHVSFVDGLFLIASLDRPVRFLIDAEQFERPIVRPIVKALGAIPISSTGGPRQMMRALKDAGAYLDDGEVVCIFPEGQITRTGGLLPFRRGLTRIVKGRDAVIVPVVLDRVWGSIFSRSGGKFFFKRPAQVPYPVTVAFGAPLPPTTPVAEVRRAVQELSSVAWEERKSTRPPLHRTAVKSLRKRRFSLALADGSRPKVSRLAALTGAIALARALRKDWEGQERVGVLLPPSVVGALVNLAAPLAGRTSVNLNFTAGPAGMGSAARQSGLRTVVTSRQFLEKAAVELPDDVTPIFLEDVAKRIGAGAKLCATLHALFSPVSWIERACGTTSSLSADDVATVIFSSGSTGEPKGVLLTHFNVDSNLEAVAQVVRLRNEDRLLGILPLFHSFGYLSLWVALNQGVPIVFHPNPVDAPVIGHLVHQYRVTMLLATPTFLQIYLRRCTPEQFGSLRLVMAGAEKLTDRLRDAFTETFGLRPLEGYGTTECAPAIAMSAPDFRAPGFFQAGSRKGSVGQPLPGVSVRIVDPDSGELLGEDEPGMLLVRGPNVMKGYLGRDDLTAKVLRDGWYVTGDIAKVDADGFVFITDRLSRFSKIGGEMVPHGKVEEALHAALGEGGTQVFAVTAVPDERKGEKLAVLYTIDADRIPAVLDGLKSAGLPNLFIPRKDAFVAVDELPVLGTGKIDLKGCKRIAAEALS